jgi:hypothetical protein
VEATVKANIDNVVQDLRSSEPVLKKEVEAGTDYARTSGQATAMGGPLLSPSEVKEFSEALKKHAAATKEATPLMQAFLMNRKKNVDAHTE